MDGFNFTLRIIESDDADLWRFIKITKRAEEALKNLGLEKSIYTDSFDDILSNPKIDAVFICGPNSLHGQQSIKALKAGKHIFCEKPCATNYDEYLMQIKLAKHNPNLVTYVNYLMNFDSMEKRICNMAKNNQFGEITQIQSTTDTLSILKVKKNGN